MSKTTQSPDVALDNGHQLSELQTNQLQTMTFLTLNEQQVSQFKQLLNEALAQIELILDEIQKLQLLLYLDKLLTWNKAYNLTAIKQPKEALIKHIFDCLTVVPLLKYGSLLDIGTGAGLPSVIIAICQPERQVTALDSNQKKVRFIRQVISELHIGNVTAVASRIEAFDGEFDVVTSRAFASLLDFVNVAEPLLKSREGEGISQDSTHSGYLQAMKGLAPSVDELEEVQSDTRNNGKIDWQVTVVPMTVPNLSDARHLVELTRD